MNEIRQGDALSVLREMPDESVHCCVTSPPYWGLRDYGTASWEGGDASCDHTTSRSRKEDIKPGDKQGTSPGSRPNLQPICAVCGAVRIDEQIGLEATPEEYVEHLVEVFREVKRVLRRDSTLWLNIGDSYTGSGKGGNPVDGKQATNKGSQTVGVLYGKTGDSQREVAVTNVTRNYTAIPPKNLVGIPWMVAFALRADGWYLRQEIIWHKLNPMPESVRDRCTKAHEQLFLLSKSDQYYFNQDAIAEPFETEEPSRLRDVTKEDYASNGRLTPLGGVPRTGYSERGTRNKRDVWTIAAEPFPEAHFATFPTALVRPCILAGCPAGGTVLDPFCGSGTTLLVAESLQCNGLGIELNPEYIEIAKRRLNQPVFAFEAYA